MTKSFDDVVNNYKSPRPEWKVFINGNDYSDSIDLLEFRFSVNNSLKFDTKISGIDSTDDIPEDSEVIVTYAGGEVFRGVLKEVEPSAFNTYMFKGAGYASELEGDSEQIVNDTAGVSLPFKDTDIQTVVDTLVDGTKVPNTREFKTNYMNNIETTQVNDFRVRGKQMGDVNRLMGEYDAEWYVTINENTKNPVLRITDQIFFSTASDNSAGNPKDVLKTYGADQSAKRVDHNVNRNRGDFDGVLVRGYGDGEDQIKAIEGSVGKDSRVLIYTDKTIVSQQEADKKAENLAETNTVSWQEIEVVPTDPNKIYSIGDELKVDSEEARLNDNYRVVESYYKIYPEQDEFESRLNLSNKPQTFVDDFKKTEEQTSSQTDSMQGARNVWGDKEAANATSQSPLIIDFEVPEDVVDIADKNRLDRVEFNYACTGFRNSGDPIDASNFDPSTKFVGTDVQPDGIEMEKSNIKNHGHAVGSSTTDAAQSAPKLGTAGSDSDTGVQLDSNNWVKIVKGTLDNVEDDLQHNIFCKINSISSTSNLHFALLGKNDTLTASFKYSPSNPALGETVDFTSTTTGAPGEGDVLTILWDIEGDYALGSDVSYVFTSSGNKDVTMEIYTAISKTEIDSFDAANDEIVVPSSNYSVGDPLQVVDSSGNNGLYTISNVQDDVPSAGQDTLTVEEDIEFSYAAGDPQSQKGLIQTFVAPVDLVSQTVNVVSPSSLDFQEFKDSRNLIGKTPEQEWELNEWREKIEDDYWFDSRQRMKVLSNMSEEKRESHRERFREVVKRENDEEYISSQEISTQETNYTTAPQVDIDEAQIESDFTTDGSGNITIPEDQNITVYYNLTADQNGTLDLDFAGSFITDESFIGDDVFLQEDDEYTFNHCAVSETIKFEGVNSQGDAQISIPIGDFPTTVPEGDFLFIESDDLCGIVVYDTSSFNITCNIAAFYGNDLGSSDMKEFTIPSSSTSIGNSQTIELDFDGGRATDTLDVDIVAANNPPTPSFTVDDSTPIEGQELEFDANGTTDDNDSLSQLIFRWDWDNDGIYEVENTGDATATHTFTSTGDKTVELQVEDTDGATASITKSFSSGGDFSPVASDPTADIVEDFENEDLNFAFSGDGDVYFSDRENNNDVQGDYSAQDGFGYWSWEELSTGTTYSTDFDVNGEGEIRLFYKNQTSSSNFTVYIDGTQVYNDSGSNLNYNEVVFELLGESTHTITLESQGGSDTTTVDQVDFGVVDWSFTNPVGGGAYPFWNFSQQNTDNADIPLNGSVTDAASPDNTWSYIVNEQHDTIPESGTTKAMQLYDDSDAFVNSSNDLDMEADQGQDNRFYGPGGYNIFIDAFDNDSDGDASYEVQLVDEANDRVEVPGDQTVHFSSGDEIRIDNDPDIDNFYTVSSTSYDSGSDRTLINLNEDLKSEGTILESLTKLHKTGFKHYASRFFRTYRIELDLLGPPQSNYNGTNFDIIADVESVIGAGVTALDLILEDSGGNTVSTINYNADGFTVEVEEGDTKPVNVGGTTVNFTVDSVDTDNNEADVTVEGTSQTAVSPDLELFYPLSVTDMRYVISDIITESDTIDNTDTYNAVVFEGGIIQDYSTSNPTFSGVSDDTYTLKLEATNNDASSPYTGEIARTTATVDTNRAPDAQFSYSPSSPQTFEAVSFTDESTDPDGSGDLDTWEWDFGDGDSTTINSAPGDTTHSYESPGTYTVTLTVTDSAGESDSTSTDIDVTDTGTLDYTIETQSFEDVGGSPTASTLVQSVNEEELSTQDTTDFADPYTVETDSYDQVGANSTPGDSEEAVIHMEVPQTHLSSEYEFYVATQGSASPTIDYDFFLYRSNHTHDVPRQDDFGNSDADRGAGAENKEIPYIRSSQDRGDLLLDFSSNNEQITLDTNNPGNDITITVGNLDELSKSVADVNTSSNTFFITGDETSVLSTGDTVTIRDSTGNDGDYTISSISYDGGDNETDIKVSEDVTDSTADGTLTATVLNNSEQITANNTTTTTTSSFQDEELFLRIDSANNKEDFDVYDQTFAGGDPENGDGYTLAAAKESRFRAAKADQDSENVSLGDGDSETIIKEVDTGVLEGITADNVRVFIDDAPDTGGAGSRREITGALYGGASNSGKQKDKQLSINQSFSIAGVDTGTDTFSIPGQQTGYIQSGDNLRVTGSTGNDGDYTVATVNYDSGNDETDLGVNETVDDSNADGTLEWRVVNDAGWYRLELEPNEPTFLKSRVFLDHHKDTTKQ